MDVSHSESPGPVNPFVFAVGCPRSGTTLLARMLDAHRDLAITPETHWIPKFYPRDGGPGGRELVTPALLDSLSAYHRIRKLKLTRDDLALLADQQAETGYASFVSRFFDVYGHKQGKRLAGDKTPSYVRVMPFLHRLWPGARFVHLIRDGRDVALSALSWDKNPRNVGRFSSFAEEPVTTAALWWAWHVRLGRSAGRDLGPGRYLELRYEDLIADPEAGCRQLAAFLDLEYDPAMTRYHEGRARAGEQLSAKKAWLPPTAGLRDWRSQMPPEDVKGFEAAAGAVLEELGYETSVADTDPQLRARTEALRTAFEAQAREIETRPQS